MAKKAYQSNIDLIIDRAADITVEDDRKDRVRSRGVTLKDSEWDALAQIAGELGVSRNALAAHWLRRLIDAYRAGEAEFEFKTERRLK